MWIADKWTDYELLDTSDGERLERWGSFILRRPDPQIIWKNSATHKKWRQADAVYKRSQKGGGEWTKNNLPEQWTISYGNLKFNLKPMGFKHTGLFPEQAANWDWFSNLIRQADRPIKVLNLFAYTGGATLAAAAAGASVVHVDASKGMTLWAKENAAASKLTDAPVRWLVDDCIKFVQREIRRGNKYDIIIMDPPSYGRGPGGEVWKLENEVYGFVELCSQLLYEDSLMVLINSYTTGLSPSVMEYILGETVQKEFGGTTESDEIGIPVSSKPGRVLPCGASAIWLGKGVK